MFTMSHLDACQLIPMRCHSTKNITLQIGVMEIRAMSPFQPDHQQKNWETI